MQQIHINTKFNAKMNTINSGLESSPRSKKAKMEFDQSSSQLKVLSDTSNRESSTHILQLNFDCFELMFKRHSLNDLLNIRLTCKQLKEYADIHIRRKYPIFTFVYGRVSITRNPTKTVGFHQDLNQIKCLEPQLAKLIKKLTFALINLRAEDFNNLKAILGQIEVFEMVDATIDSELYTSVLQFCT